MEELEQAIRADTLLVSVMHVNNETGLIHDVEEIALGMCRSQRCFFHGCHASCRARPH